MQTPLAMTYTPLTLPPLNYSFDALEPFISGQINEIHYTKHHQAYVNGYNTAINQLNDAENANDVFKTVQLQQAIKFNGGGFRNHNLFWGSLAPVSQGGGEYPTGPLAEAIENEYGSFEELIKLVNTKLASVQGSGWAWVVKNNENGAIEVVTTANQDTVGPQYTPLLAIDAWEHAYYLQYQNVKADYFNAIWNVVNWHEAESRLIAGLD